MRRQSVGKLKRATCFYCEQPITRHDRDRMEAFLKLPSGAKGPSITAHQFCFDEVKRYQAAR